MRKRPIASVGNSMFRGYHSIEEFLLPGTEQGIEKRIEIIMKDHYHVDVSDNRA